MRERVTTRFVAAPPDDVFGLITALERLTEWNAAIVRVVDSPDALRPGADWVELHPATFWRRVLHAL